MEQKQIQDHIREDSKSSPHLIIIIFCYRMLSLGREVAVLVWASKNPEKGNNESEQFNPPVKTFPLLPMHSKEIALHGS